MNLENYFISQFKSKHIGDDGAFVGSMVYSQDAFFEDVHFKRDWMTLFDIAKKAMLVNISDAIAMNATPKYALLSVAMPKSMSKSQMQELAEGFLSVAKEYNMEIIGGDTISNTKLDISITVISATKTPLLRLGIRSGYLLGYSGEIGNSAKDLKKLLRGGTIHKGSKFQHIVLPREFMRRSARYLKAGMDISDGLYSDLDKMSLLNRVGFRFLRKIPNSIGCSGEEYEMLFAFDPRERKTLLRRAMQSRTKITIFAEAIRRSYSNRCKAHHF